MARSIYEIKLKEPYFPAQSEAEAIELLKDKDTVLFFSGPGIEVTTVVNEEDTMKLFILAKTMYDLEKFELNQIRLAVKAVAGQMGNYIQAEQITECVLSWTEKFDEMTLSELEEWIIG